MPSRQHRVSPAIVAAGLAGCFAALSIAVTLHPAPFRIDMSVLADMRAARTRPTTEFARVVTTAGSPPVTTAILCLLSALVAWRRRSVATLVLAGAALFITGVADSTAKRLVGRPRPPIAVRVPHVSAGGMSFPSGHTTDATAFLVLAAALLAICAPRQRTIYLSGAWLAAALVGWSRLYLGVHYLTDVAGSLLLGGCVVAAVTAAAHRWTEPPAPESPPATMRRSPARSFGRRRLHHRLRVRGWLALLLPPVLLLPVGCSDQASSVPAAPAAPHASSPAPASTPGSVAPRQRITKLLTIVEENHSLQQAQAGMPYLRQLALTFGYAVNYRGISHPSLPNYLAIASGSSFGITDDAPPSAHPITGPSVFGRANRAGRTARLYAESMPQPCDVTPTGAFAVKHTPWAYFVDERAMCRDGMVPAGTPSAGALAHDIAAGQLPVVGMLIPNLTHDAHDGTHAEADAWLRQWVEPLLHGRDFTTGRLAIVITADEDDSSSGNRVLTVVIAPGVRHVVVSTPLTHYSLARTYAEVSGTAPLREAGSATSLATAFGLRLSA
jgi:acid phosphatase